MNKDRIFPIVFLGLAVFLIVGPCLADDHRQLQDLPEKLADVSEQLHNYFCPGPNGFLGLIPSHDFSHHILCDAEEELCPICSLFITARTMPCFQKDDLPEVVASTCGSNSQMFVCGFEDAAVCKDALGVCVYKTKGMGSDQPFCVCTSDSRNSHDDYIGRCLEPPVPTNKPLDVGSLVIACCLSLITVIIIAIVLICYVWRKRVIGYRTETSSKPDEIGSQDPNIEAQTQAHGQAVSQRPPDYSYAYCHRLSTPASNANLILGDEPDLDEQQRDHYYSVLKTDSGNQGASSGTEAPNMRPETGTKDSSCDGDQTDSGRKNHATEEASGTEDGGSRQRDEQVHSPYVEVQTEGDPPNQSSGYEIARVRLSGDVTPVIENQSTDTSLNRDSGYEIATAVNPTEDEKRHSLFTLEPPKQNGPENSDTGYEEVTQVNAPQTESNHEFSAYDHLKRPVLEKQTEGAIP